MPPGQPVHRCVECGFLRPCKRFEGDLLCIECAPVARKPAVVADGGREGDQSRGSIELTDRQRERLDAIKSECASEHLPEPSDQQILSSLLDTWDAVGDELYSNSSTADSDPSGSQR